MRRLWQPSTSESTRSKAIKTCPTVRSGERLKATAAARDTGAKADVAGFEPRARFWPQTWRDPVKHWTTLAAAGFLAAAAFVPAQAADISGAGATFPYPIYAKWADAYKKETGNGLNYQSIGSGGGIKQITASTVTFGASDMPLQAGRTRQDRRHPVPDRDGRHRAGRQSRRHQDRRSHHRRPDARQDLSSARSRPGTTRRSRSSTRTPSCRSQAIAVVHRSDGSGTTFIFTNYLSKVSADWKSQGRQQHLGRMAGRHRRQGQRRRRQQRRATPRARSAMSNMPTPSRTS